MKTIQTTLQRIPGMVCKGLIILLLFLPAVACKKNTTSLPTLPDDINAMANSLQGVLLSGTLTTASDDEGMALLINGEKILIALEKIPLHGIADPGSIEHAEIVYSDYGVIIHDKDTGKCWYYIQNDAKSNKQFGSLKDAGRNPVISNIGGTIKFNS